MKVCLLFYGQSRFLDSPKSSAGIREHIISKYDTDTYGHTWDSDTFTASSWANLQPIPASDIEKKIKNQYPSIRLHIEPAMTFSNDTDSNNILSQFWSIERVGNMVKNPEQYDKIILTRYDVDLLNLEPIDLLPDGFYVMKEYSLGQLHHCPLPDQLIIFSPRFLDFTKLYSNNQELTSEPFYGVEILKLRLFNKLFSGEPLQKHPIELELIRK